MAGMLSFMNRFHILKQIPIFVNLNWFELQKIARKMGALIASSWVTGRDTSQLEAMAREFEKKTAGTD